MWSPNTLTLQKGKKISFKSYSYKSTFSIKFIANNSLRFKIIDMNN